MSGEGKTPISRLVARSELPGIALLAGALLFNAVLLAPELRIGRLPPNDGIFHLAASERLATSIARGEPFLDPWVSEWSLGYPLWRSYQPLPHMVAALAITVARPLLDPPSTFAALVYALLVLWPASVYGGARLLGLGPVGSGIASVLVLLPNGTGEFGHYGLGFAATTWRGSGLYTQIFALHLLVWSLGVTRRALDRGTTRALTAVLLAATTLSHLVFGYVAFVSAAVLALVGPAGLRLRRLRTLLAAVLGSGALLAWFVVPLVMTRAEINHSRWEEEYKWDSFGAPVVLRALLSIERRTETQPDGETLSRSPVLRGTLFDGTRRPWLTLVILLGSAAAALHARQALSRRLLALSGLWLLLFFGRPTWGRLVLLAGVPAELHMHRLQAAFQMAAILLAACGLQALLHRLRWAGRGSVAVVWLGLAAALLPALRDQQHYLDLGRIWGENSLAVYERHRADIDAALSEVRAILAERPGRVSAGPAAGWGGNFTIGALSFYAFLTRAHLDQVSFLYHAMSQTSDVMILYDQRDPVDNAVFGVRAVVAPAYRRMPPELPLRAVYGGIAVYEASPEGYFGLVDVGARYTGAPASFYELSAGWLRSAWAGKGVVAILGGGGPQLPAFGRGEPLPPLPDAVSAARGRILSERKDGERYFARLRLLRPCHALIKITWFPGLRATVDGHAVKLWRVTPGFGAFAVPAGTHEVVVEYRPGSLKPVLLLSGLVAFLAWVRLTDRRKPQASLRSC